MGNSKEGTVWAVPTGTTSVVVTKLWNRLGNHGARVITQLHNDAAFQERTAEFLLCGGIKPSPHIELVRAIMGNERVWGVEEWASFYGVRFSNRELRQVAKFPWDQEVLNAPCPFNKGKLVRETHCVRLGLDKVNGVPLTILEWQKLHPAGGDPHFYSYAPNSWYHEQKFAKEPTCTLRWYLDLRDIIPDSESRTWEDQLTLIPPEYEVMTAVGNVAKDLHVYRKQGLYPNTNRYGRCADATSSGSRVHVGYDAFGGLDVDGWPGGWPGPSVGLSVSRKLPS